MLGAKDSSHSSPYSSFKCAPQEGQSPRNHHLLNSSPRPSSQSQYKPVSFLFNVVLSSAELVKEITNLEGEIIYLERYILSLYRAAFEQHIPSSPGGSKTSSQNKSDTESRNSSDKCCLGLEPKLCKDSPDYYNQSLPFTRNVANLDDQKYAATPKSSCKKGWATANQGHRSLAEHLVTSRMDVNLSKPDRLSEDIIRCMSSIYCRLADSADSTPRNTGLSASSNSSLSSSSTLSPRNLSENWSPHFNEETGGSQIQGLKEDSSNLAAKMLQNFKLLVKNLEKVEPLKMTREEKLAFWINIHNALVMHAHLAYGTSNYVKSNAILKAAYTIGGQYINADIIQSSILGIRSHYTAPWLDTLLSPGKKSKAVNSKHVYSIDYPEPLVHFALCSGAFSDPSVRVYTADNIFKDLRLAKEEFIQANVYVHKETKVCLPKMLEDFAKDMSLNMTGLLDIVSACLSEAEKKAIARCIKGKPEKCISWLGQNSKFGYVINREAVGERRLSV
ncbi:hypothetical protein DCAR_0311119 [Daucus carota subsp. sativus]|uniref:DUF547 domain-containing protein n=1 Tax=Daucus carota subsp. sativus TaxID=79200 RepID=A0AAF0WLM9_DAUCS|nr:hypothetical protein DCAR_0311119 [Daucus carota subsp. sativus]